MRCWASWCFPLCFFFWCFSGFLGSSLFNHDFCGLLYWFIQGKALLISLKARITVLFCGLLCTQSYYMPGLFWCVRLEDPVLCRVSHSLCRAPGASGWGLKPWAHWVLVLTVCKSILGDWSWIGWRAYYRCTDMFLSWVWKEHLFPNVAGSLGLCIFILVTIPESIYPWIERLPVKDLSCLCRCLPWPLWVSWSTEQCCSEEAASCQSPSPRAAVSKHSQPECLPSPWQPEQRTCFLSQLCFPFCVISHLCCKVP